MANGTPTAPYFRLVPERVSTLPAPGRVFVYHAVTMLRIIPGGSDEAPLVFPFRLDTLSNMSLIPGSWFSGGKRKLIGPLSAEQVTVPLTGFGHPLRGRVATLSLEFDPNLRRDAPFAVRALVVDDPELFFGVLSIRDLLIHFRGIQSAGPHRVSASGTALITPNLVVGTRNQVD